MPDQCETLLLRIARCQEVKTCLSGKLGEHPCSTIVRWQHNQHPNGLEAYQVPEPWNGDIRNAPILFVSSNPSFSVAEWYPTSDCDDQTIRSFFTERLERHLRDGTKSINRDGTISRATQFNSTVKSWAKFFLARAPRPGLDYALTEVVHCKSTGEIGVREAARKCAKLYLKAVIEVSGARCLVILGAFATRAINADLGLAGQAGDVIGPFILGDRERLLIYLHHTNHRGLRHPTKVISETNLRAVKEFMSQT